jgi:Uma2 family endonuclease
MSHKVEATIDDLYKVEGKAELVNGEIVHMSPTGGLPGFAARQITFSLAVYEKAIGQGYAISDYTAFIVNLPNRKSFSPDAGYYNGKITMKFFEGAPVFAVEVRSESDYGARAERILELKRADYFAAGTLVVWDVDLLSEDVVRVYSSDQPSLPRIYRRAQLAEAESALPGWTMPVDNLFPAER